LKAEKVEAEFLTDFGGFRALQWEWQIC